MSRTSGTWIGTSALCQSLLMNMSLKTVNLTSTPLPSPCLLKNPSSHQTIWTSPKSYPPQPTLTTQNTLITPSTLRPLAKYSQNTHVTKTFHSCSMPLTTKAATFSMKIIRTNNASHLITKYMITPHSQSAPHHPHHLSLPTPLPCPQKSW